MSLKPGEIRLGTATAAKTGSTVTAKVDGAVTTVQVARDLTVASGDVLFVARFGSQWVALQRMFPAAPAAIDDNDDAPPAITVGKTVIAPVETASYISTGWRTDNDSVRQGAYGGGANNTGAVFYGMKPSSLAGATITKATIQVKRLPQGLLFATVGSTLRLMTESTKPSGAPTLTSSTTGPALGLSGIDNAFEIPVSWAQAMVDGTAGGIAFFDSDGSPFVVFAGRTAWGPAFAMTLEWTRS